jgi:AcrR family transcriptional regulator
VRVTKAGDRTLPLAGRPPATRTDALASRRKILRAAAELVRARGVASLTMNEVAAAAGVGVGTVYRRFQDRAGLVYALIDQREREFQAAFLGGPPPLGPGAPPGRRIRAFLHALADRTEEQTELLVLAETTTPDARYGGAYGAYHEHLALLLGQARPDADAHYLADALLAPLAATLFDHQRRARGMGLDRLKAGLGQLLDGLPGGPEG